MTQKKQAYDFPEPHSRAQQVFLSQRQACMNEPFPPYKARLENLRKLDRLVDENTGAIAAAISRDFGHRSEFETRFLEVFPSLSGIRHTARHLMKWMKPQHRDVDLLYFTGSNRVIPQPKGIVGIVVPWNYPLYLMIGPLTSALAAGNRCMVKMAANSRNLCGLMNELFSKTFPEELLTVLPDVPGAEFSALPFNHLIFTGSADSGKNVMRSAAGNLCPVTLELGGKSPVIICDDFDLKEAASRIIYGKLVNAGQTCLAPDYLFIPEQKAGEFVELAKKIAVRRYPDINSENYTSIIDERSYRRLRDTLDDAVSRGAAAVRLTEGDFNDSLRKIPPHLVLDVNDDMRIMTDEIFGPLLPVKTYSDLDDAVRYINGKDRPLALYLFSNNRAVQEKVLYNTMSGGVTLNHVILHIAQHDLPFGGIGPSGMGQYHGFEGFAEFSKMRPVFTYPKISTAHLIFPPYRKFHKTLSSFLNRLKL
jgi:coniferyl-aldehyde dehydrogenase